MKKFKKLISMAITYIFVMTIILQALPSSVRAAGKAVKPLKAVDGQVVFKLKDSKYAGYNELLTKFEGKVLSKQDTRILVQVDKKAAKDLISQLQKDTNIEYAEVNALGTKQGASNDQYLSTQDYLYYSHVLEGWDNITTVTADAIKVAVVDSGIEGTHPDLTGKVLTGFNVLDGSTNTSDENGHGTQVAGIIAANYNNSIGIAGVSGKANVKLIPIKVTDASGNGTSFNVATGIDKAVSLGASIINISINGEGYSKDVEQAINRALAAGKVVIVSAGNQSDYAENYWPANVQGAIAVTQLRGTEDYALYGGSNYGKMIALSALGSGNTTTINKGYTSVKGSSFAAAVVTGAAVLAKTKNPGYNKDQIESLLKKSADPKGFNGYNHYTGYGVVDVLKMTNTAAGFVEIVSPSSGEAVTGSTIALKFKALAPVELKTYSVLVNDDDAGINNVVSNGGGTYTVNIDAAKLKEGSNKIIVNAVSSKDSKTYTDYRYIRKYTASSGSINIKLINKDGAKLEKGTKVYLTDEEGFGATAALADENGAVSFHKLNPRENYRVSYTYDSYVNGVRKPVFYSKLINGTGTGELTLDASGTNSKSVALSALKSDQTLLLNSRLHVNLYNVNYEYEDVFVNGIANIYVNNDLSLQMRVINDNEGYLYQKDIQSFSGISSIVFNTDTTVAKVNMTNDDKLKLSEQLLSITGYGNYNTYFTSTINVKKDFIYVTKGSYYWNYETNAKDSLGNDWNYPYSERVLDISADTALKYGKFNVNLTMVENDVNKEAPLRFKVEVKDSYNNFIHEKSILTEDVYNNIKILDSTGKEISNAVKSVSYINGQTVELEFNSSLPSAVYYVQSSMDLGPLGISASNKLAFNYVNSLSKNISVNIKAPYAKPYDLHYKIYDKATKGVLIDGWDYSTGQSITIDVDRSKLAASNEIVIFGESPDNYKFIYCRDLPVTSTNQITIDGSDTGAVKAKRLNIKLDDITKNKVLTNSDIKIFSSLNAYEELLISGSEIAADGTTNVWLDNGSYNVLATSTADKYLLGSDVTITDTNNKLVLSTTNLAKVSSNVTSFISGYKKTGLSFERRGENNYEQRSFDIAQGEVAYVSPKAGFTLTNVVVNAYDEASGKNYFYNFMSNTAMTENLVKQFNFTDFTLENIYYRTDVDLPSEISAKYTIRSGGMALNHIQATDNYDFMNEYWSGRDRNGMYLNLVNETGKVVSTNRENNKGYTDTMEGYLSDYTLTDGTYYLKVMLPDNVKQMTNYSMPVNITATNLKKIKVMDPFNTTKVLVNNPVTVNGRYYFTDDLGYIYVSSNEVTNASSVVVQVDNANGIAVYSPSSIEGSEVIIAKSISQLKNVTVKQANVSGKINLANERVDLKNDANRQIFSFNLNSEGQRAIYVDTATYSVVVDQYGDGIPAQYELRTSFDAGTQSEAVIENNKVATIESNDYVYMTVGPYEYSYNHNFKGTMYVSLGSNVRYNYSKNVGNENEYGKYVQYNNSFTPTLEQVYTVGLGSTFTITAQPENITADANGVYNLQPNSYIRSRLTIKDEYNNDITLSYGIAVKAVVSQSNGETSYFNCYENGQNAYSFTVTSGNGASKLKYEVDFGTLGKVVSQNDVNINMDLTNYYEFTIKDMSGSLSNGGQIMISSEPANSNDSPWIRSTATITSNGKAYLLKTDLDINTKYFLYIQGNTKAANEPFIFSRAFNKDSLTYTANTNMSKVNLTIPRPAAVNYDNANITINKNKLNIFNKGTYDIRGDVNQIVWLENGEYSFRGSLSNYSTYYDLRSLKQNISGSKNISLSTTNVSEIKAVSSAGDTLNNISLSDSEFSSGYGFGGRNVKIYATKQIYDSVNINFSTDKFESYNFYKNYFILKDDITEIHFGNKPYTLMNGYDDREVKLPGYIRKGENLSINAYSAKDENGYNFSLYQVNSVELSLNLYKGGILVKSIKGDNRNGILIPADTADGIYDAEITGTIPKVGTVKTNRQTVSIGLNNALSIYVPNDYYYVNSGVIKILDGTNEVATLEITGGRIDIVKSALTDNKKYTVAVATKDYSNKFELYNSEFTYTSDMNMFYLTKPSNMKEVTVKGVPSAKLKITNSKGTNVEQTIGTEGQTIASLQPDNYTLNVNDLSKANNNYYILAAQATVTADTAIIGVDYSNASQITVGTEFAKKPYDITYEFKKEGSSIVNKVSYSNLANNKIYVDKAKYNAAVTIGAGSKTITGSYEVDASGTAAQLIIGKNLTAKVNLNSAAYNVDSAISLSGAALYDGTTLLSGLSLSDYTISSYDLMHGSKVIKNFTGGVSSMLQGDTSIRLNLTSEDLGNIASEAKSIVVNNPTFAAVGDINLDRTVDIYDLVLISKDMGNKKGVTPDWDGRCNLDNQDTLNIIDIKDIAKAAQNYNKKY
ncbi:S8 family serine peptidase [Clostridium swellfunianum]|uniref:S8 family serine peptidase n=1 Tax=Clostridium swellfunianum TaxID=1367462 RepID=UPI00202FF34B|nr:S8 family serine peptidase [Clostridium swellfunianum]MCM0647405.1 S8 family serine peptidase [Clostridium swellfunianum]